MSALTTPIIVVVVSFYDKRLSSLLVFLLLLLLLFVLCVVAVVVPVIARVRILVRHRVLAVLIRPEIVSERRLAPDVDLMMRYAATS